MHSHPALSFLVTACLLTPLHSLRADNEINSAETTRLEISREVLTQEQIEARARAQQPGEITEIELKQKNGQYAYEVDVVDGAGVKRELTFDAKTGELLATEEDDDDGDNDNSKDKDDDD